jgi:quercetin dioxygenase-like cupin family protein
MTMIPTLGFKKAQAMPIRELGAASPDSIVSRTLIKKETGTVTYFAFGAGQGLSTHSAPFDALVQVLEGAASITIGETTHTVKAGELIILPANEPHAVDAKQDFTMLLTMIRS